MNNFKEKKNFKRFKKESVIFIILATIAVIYSIMFMVSVQIHNIMISDLKDRVKIVNEFALNAITIDSFKEINTINDEEKNCYVDIQKKLNEIRKISNTRYLYTAKYNKNGELIYIIDGLDSNAEDFRHPGMFIEEEIIPDLQRCLQGDIVMGDDFLDTEWGKIFISYWPVYDNNKVIGAIGMEFDVESLSQLYDNILVYSFLFSIFIILIVYIITIFLWKFVSEPFYTKLACTDHLTDFWNRTAFEIDCKKLNTNISNDNQITILMFDLNNLKLVNDIYGHISGDEYIKKASECIESCFGKIGSCYRIGGDEFVTITKNKSYDFLLSKINNEFSSFHSIVKSNSKEDWTQYFGIAYGIAEYDKELDKSLNDTYKRADIQMYNNKKQMKEKI